MSEHEGSRFARRGQFVILSALGIALLSIPSLVSATTYYVARQGSDQSDGSAPERAGESGPWRTLTNLTKIKFRQGDQVLLHCGERFAGPVALEVTADGKGTFKIGRYGSCAPDTPPAIDGATTLSANPTKTDGTLFSAQVSGELAQVFWNGVPVPIARYPQSSYVPVKAPTGNVKSEVQTAGLPSADLVGAGVSARTQAWFIEERRIANVFDGKAMLDRPLDYALDAGSGYFLTGKAWMIGAEPGWGLEGAARALVVRPPQRGGAEGSLAVSLAAPLLQISGKGAVSVSDIALERAGGDALDIRTSGVVDVTRVVVKDAAVSGIHVVGASEVRIEDCTIENVGRDGVSVERSRSAVIRSNAVREVATRDRPTPSLGAINASSVERALIQNNTVTGAGYIGIRFREGAMVEGNVIERVCVTMADCGGIYSWRNDPSDKQARSTIVGNTVLNVKGNQEIKPGWRSYAAGIYLDDHVANVQVRGNVVIGARQGIYLHNAAQNVIEGNVTLDSEDVSLAIVIDSEKYAPDKALDNVIRRNGFLAERGEGAVLVIQRTPNKALRSFTDNSFSGAGDKTPLVQYRNEGSVKAPKYRQSKLSIDALAGSNESNVSLQAALPVPRDLAGRWRVERRGEMTTSTSEGGKVVIVQGVADGVGGRELTKGMKCQSFRPAEESAANDGSQISTTEITLCR